MARLGGLGYLASSPQSVFTEPSMAAFLISVFGLAYIYKTLNAGHVTTLVTAIAYTFSISAILALFITVLQPGSFYYAFFVTFFNPLFTSLWSLLALSGVIALSLTRKP